MINITIFPKDVYIERGNFSQYINFDFLLENLSGEDLEINTVQVSAFDSKNNLLFRKFINKNGCPASIYTLPDIKLKNKGALFVFNPFIHLTRIWKSQNFSMNFSLIRRTNKKNINPRRALIPYIMKQRPI